MTIKPLMVLVETTPTGLQRTYKVHSVSERAAHLEPLVDDGEHNPQTWDLSALRTAIRSGSVKRVHCDDCGAPMLATGHTAIPLRCSVCDAADPIEQ